MYEISRIIFAILKLYFWSIHMANNLILPISFGFKLNSNLKFVRMIETERYKFLVFWLYYFIQSSVHV